LCSLEAEVERITVTSIANSSLVSLTLHDPSLTLLKKMFLLFGHNLKKTPFAKSKKPSAPPLFFETLTPNNSLLLPPMLRLSLLEEFFFRKTITEIIILASIFPNLLVQPNAIIRSMIVNYSQSFAPSLSGVISSLAPLIQSLYSLIIRTSPSSELHKTSPDIRPDGTFSSLNMISNSNTYQEHRLSLPDQMPYLAAPIILPPSPIIKLSHSSLTISLQDP